MATSLSLLENDQADELPNFSAYIYGVTQMTKANIQWLEESLFHRKMSAKEIKAYTFMDLVSEKTTPTFLVHAYDGDICFIEETSSYADLLQKNNISVETHIFPKGGHGFGLGRESDGTNQWIDLFGNWLKRID